MHIYRNLRVRSRLLLQVGIVAVLLLVLSGASVLGANSEGSTVTKTRTYVNLLLTIDGLRSDAGAIALAENSIAFDYASKSDPTGDLASFSAGVAAYAKDWSALQSFQAAHPNAVRAKFLTEVKSAYTSYVAESTQVNTDLAGGTPADLANANTVVAELSYGSVAKPIEAYRTNGLADFRAQLSNASSQSSTTILLSVVLGVIALVISIIGGLTVASSVSRPLGEATRRLKQAADGDLDVRLDDGTSDEFGELAGSMNEFLERIAATILAMSKSVKDLEAYSGSLSSISVGLSDTSDRTLREVNAASSSVGDVRHSVELVASSTDEMKTAIEEIARGADQAARVASEAVRTAAGAEGSIEALNDAAAKVGEVVRVITGIAEQVNLLALNATIEAARAGEAGKGFAVVASEVKDLANSTSKATQDISSKIEAMQGSTASAVGAIRAISTVISQINELQSSIAAAVEEQSATTGEIVRAVGEASGASDDISRRMGDVVSVAESTATSVTSTESAAADLGRIAAQFEAIVATYKVSAVGGSNASRTRSKGDRSRFERGQGVDATSPDRVRN